MFKNEVNQSYLLDITEVIDCGMPENGQKQPWQPDTLGSRSVSGHQRNYLIKNGLTVLAVSPSSLRQAINRFGSNRDRPFVGQDNHFGKRVAFMSGRHWAVILGASSGFGAAASRRLAKAGFNIFGVHLDRRATMGLVDEVRSDIESVGGQAVFFNINASPEEKRREVIDQIKTTLGDTPPDPPISTLIHSLAFGTLKPFVGASDEVITKPQMDMTLDVMAHTLVYWTQDLFREGLLANGSKIFAMTSSGGERVFQTYGAVSAAKAALESHIRQLAFELAPHGISANSIRAGVTDTPALRKIPGHDRLIADAIRKNPSGRLTTPEDVAKTIVALTMADTHWITGNVIGVDGGEHVVD